MRVSPQSNPTSGGSALAAGFVYFAIVFAAGFALGVLRTVLIAPAVGETAAVSLELPFMLAISWFAARALIRRFRIGASLRSRLTMGGVAFALLMIAEICFSLLLWGRTLFEYIELFRSAPALVGLAGQIAFGLFPAMLLQKPEATLRS